MGYTALYRTWRPADFASVVGQEQVVRTLKSQAATGRVAHAYLFSGLRGTGKTSLAKIFARAINCIEPINGEPCGQCPPCRALENENLDILEIDAASNNGVDQIRDLKDKLAFPPTVGKYKVYIIDEVHMLSAGAFNALLKTLEEPPAYVVFILATTEPHRLPATILSRCQRFEFRAITLEDIRRHTAHVAKESGITLEEDALQLIAVNAEGGLRDALSLLDTCRSYAGDKITGEDAAQVLGVADEELLTRTARALLEGDAAGVLALCGQLYQQGKDIPLFLRDLAGWFSDFLLFTFTPANPQLAKASASRRAALEELSPAGPDRALRALELLCAAEAESRLHARPALALEAVLVRICRPQDEAGLAALQSRMERLESLPAGLAEIKTTGNLTSTNDLAQPEKTAEQPKPEKKNEKAELPPPVADLYQALMTKLRKNNALLYTLLKKSAGGERRGGAFVFFFSDETPTAQAVLKNREEEIKKELFALCGEELVIRAEQRIKQSEAENLRNQAIALFGAENIRTGEE